MKNKKKRIMGNIYSLVGGVILCIFYKAYEFIPIIYAINVLYMWDDEWKNYY